MSQRITRAGAAAVLAAVGYLAEAVVVLVHRGAGFDGGAEDRLLDLAYAVAVLAGAVALPAVTRRAGLGRLGVVGGWIGAAGLVAMGVESGVGVVHRVDALGVLFGLGILLSLLGLLLLAVAGLVAGTPRWLATLPLAAVVAAAAGGEVGASIVSAALWLVLARRIAAPEPVASAPAGSRAAASTA